MLGLLLRQTLADIYSSRRLTAAITIAQAPAFCGVTGLTRCRHGQRSYSGRPPSCGVGAGTHAPSRFVEVILG